MSDRVMRFTVFIAVAFCVGVVAYAMHDMGTPAYMAHAEAERVNHEVADAKWLVTQMVFVRDDRLKKCFGFSKQSVGLNETVNLPFEVSCTPEVLDFIAKHK